MSKFVVLYLVPVATVDHLMANSTPEQMKASIEEWTHWMNANERAFVDMGAPLGKTKRVTAGGIASVRNEVTGYTIIEAESHEAAARMLEGHPHLQVAGAYIDVIAVMPIPKA
ncbi:hypothetical protein RCH09_002129 [Actimicrobium sp. GrIS 1.19]|uniref:hypothetical protein n=1 Tax=Actimicrobium sp. GrIS 1.19 TaxID=3071708 RepID=UPI002E0C1A2E|nr:hypothetical protein [Actimicrobium sp. GrIS 1.19]